MTQPNSSFVAEEPVVVAAGVTWLFAWVGTYLLGHTHLVTSSQWSALSTFLIPTITGVVLAGLAWVVRKSVTPAAHLTAATPTASLTGVQADVAAALAPLTKGA